MDVNSDGVYEEVRLEQKPEPAQGNDQWKSDFSGSIKYPASAGIRSICGIVVLEILVNKLGADMPNSATAVKK